MVKPIPKFNLRKLKALKSDPQFHKYYKEYEKIQEILKESPKIKSNAVVKALKKYVLISLVTMIEDTFRFLVQDAIDSNEFDFKNLFEKNEILIPLSNLEIIKNSEFTKGAIVATNFNFQNLREINFVVSRILGFAYFETFRKILETSVKIGLDKLWDESDNHPHKILKNWKNFEKMFDLRNDIVHNMDRDVPFSIDELELLASHTVVILEFSTFLIVTIDWIRRGENWLGGDDASYQYGIRDFSKLQEIILKKTSEFKSKKRT